MPTASVSATNVATNIKTSARANEAGAYTIPQLIEGTYKVRTEASGFKAMVVDNVVLAARDVRRLDLKMEVGTVETVVEVSGGATLIETESARISDSKDALVLNAIPTNSRALWAVSEPVAGIAGAGREQRDAFRGQPGQREQLVDRRHYFLGRRGQHADRAARQLYRVVPGSAGRLVEQLRRISFDWAGHR